MCTEGNTKVSILKEYLLAQMGGDKLPAVITSLDSTLYHCHQQCFSPKYRRIRFFLIIFFSGLISSKYSIFPLKILNNHN